jgi:hypothetical protein
MGEGDFDRGCGSSMYNGFLFTGSNLGRRL